MTWILSFCSETFWTWNTVESVKKNSVFSRILRGLQYFSEIAFRCCASAAICYKSGLHFFCISSNFMLNAEAHNTNKNLENRSKAYFFSQMKKTWGLHKLLQTQINSSNCKETRNEIIYCIYIRGSAKMYLNQQLNNSNINFWTFNELEHVHHLKIELRDLIFGFNQMNIEPNRAFTRFTKLLIELTWISFFRTSNKLESLHLLVIEFEHHIFGFQRSNIKHSLTHHYFQVIQNDLLYILLKD